MKVPSCAFCHLPLARPNGVRPVQHTRGSNWTRAPLDPNRRQDGCNGLRTRSLKPRRVAVSKCPTVTSLDRARLLHQVQTRRIRHDPSLALSDRCNGFTTRALTPRRVAVSKCPTVTSLDRARPCIRCKLDASVTIRPPLPTPVQRG
jgi:hypothetical protein